MPTEPVFAYTGAYEADETHAIRGAARSLRRALGILGVI